MLFWQGSVSRSLGMQLECGTATRGGEREKVEGGRVGAGKGGVVVVGKSLLLTLNSSYFFSFFIF